MTLKRRQRNGITRIMCNICVHHEQPPEAMQTATEDPKAARINHPACVYVDAARVARVLGVTRRHVYNLLERGELEGRRVGSAWRIPKAELDRFKPKPVA